MSPIILSWIFLFKVCNTAWIMPNFGERFYQLLLSGFNMDYPNNPEDNFCTFLVVMHVCLSVKPLKKVCAFSY